MSRESRPERRVAVTGIGLISPLGTGTDKTWQALLRGESGIGPLTRFDLTRYATRFGGEVKDFDPLAFVDRKEARKMDLFIRFGLGAADLAVRDSGLPPGDLQSDRAGVYVGSGIGGLGAIEENHKVLLEKGPDRVTPFFIIQTVINEASGQISIRFGAKGPNCANATACATGTHAIGDSFRIIARGDADIMITGGAEAPLTPLSLAGFISMKAVSERNDEPAKASRPFDAKRDGFVMSEGAGVVVLEELGHALRRERPDLRRGRRLRHDGRRLSRRGAGPQRRRGHARHAAGHRGRRHRARRTSSTSTPTARRRRSTTRSRRWPSRPSSGTTPGGWPSAPRNP